MSLRKRLAAEPKGAEGLKEAPDTGDPWAPGDWGVARGLPWVLRAGTVRIRDIAAGHQSVGCPAGGSETLVFYQSSDGQLIFLEPHLMKQLLQNYRQDPDPSLPRSSELTS